MALSIRKYALILIILLLAFAAAWLVVKNQQNMVNSDFFTFWLGANLVGDGQNVYDPATWAEGHNRYGSTWLENRHYVYPLPLALFQLPIGWLPLPTAATLWVFVSICCVMASILLLRIQGYPVINTIILVIGVFLQRSVFTTLRNGQLGAVLLLLFVLCLWLMSKRRDVWAGICLSILVLKPTIGLPIAGMILLYSMLKRQYRVVLSCGVSLVVQIAISLIFSPGWISAFLSLGASKGNTVAGFTPTWWGIAGAVCSIATPCLTILGMIGSLVIAGAGVFLVVKNHPIWTIWQVGSFIICVSLFLTPYLWAYDQILLLFPLIWLARSMHQHQRPTLALLVPLLFAIIGYLLLGVAVSSGNDRASVINTLMMIVCLGLAFQQEKRLHERISNQNK